MAQCAARATELAARLEQIAHAEEHEGARSVELTQRGFSLSLLPFDVAERFASHDGRHARRLDIHFRHAVGRRGLHALHVAPRAGGSRDARHRQPLRLRVAGAALSTAEDAGSRGADAYAGRGGCQRAADRGVGRRGLRAVHQPPRTATRRAAAARALDRGSANFRCWCRARRRASSCCACFATRATRCCWGPRVSGKAWT